jgi:hypothetical protein
VVLRSLRRRTRLTASAVTAVFGAMLVVTCVSAQMTPEERACCAAMHHDCGAMALEASCCTGETDADHSLGAVKLTSATFALAIVTAILDLPATPATSTSRFARTEPSALKPPRVPTYLFVSSFRI